MNAALDQAAAVIGDARMAIAIVLLAIGAVLLFVGAVGQMRLPDFYTRLHAAAPAASLGGGLVLAALAVEAWDGQMTLRLLLVAALVAALGPAIAHMLANAAHVSGLAPRTGRLREQKAPPP